MKIDQVYAPEVGHPAYTLKWLLQSWAAGLTEGASRFPRYARMRGSEFPPATLINSPKGHLPVDR